MGVGGDPLELPVFFSQSQVDLLKLEYLHCGWCKDSEMLWNEPKSNLELCHSFFELGGSG